MEIWITGTGMVTSVGPNRRACFESLCDGRSGVAPLQAFDPARYGIKNAYEIPDRESGEVPLRASRWLVQAIVEALDEAAITADDPALDVVVGTGLRELRSFELHATGGSALRADQLHFAGAVRTGTHAKGRVITLSNACAASIFGLGVAEDLIRVGAAEAVVVAGCDAITESMFGLLDRVTPAPPDRVEPFENSRRGVIMGEGAAAVVLEEASRARRRGAVARAVLRGVGLGCDAHHETVPHREGIARVIRDAHRRAGVRPEEVDLMLAHGTGTALNDKTEAEAIADVFAPGQRRFVLSGIKSMTGHTSGASGLVGVVTATLALEAGRIPPTVGLRDPIPETDGMTIASSCVERDDLRLAQINAFGFGGVDAVALVEAAR